MEVRQNLKKRLKLCLAAIFAGVLLAGMSATVLAAQAEVIDPDKSGSITVTMHNTDGEAVGGGTLALYQVAYVYVDAVGQNSYVLTSAFQNSGADLDDISSNDHALAVKLADYVNSQYLTAYRTAEIGSNGVVTFSNLPVGVYLVMQTEAADDYYKVGAFVVTVPLSVNGTLNYDVDASPKVEAMNLIPEPEEPSEETSETTESTAQETTSAQTGSGLTLPQTGAILWPVFLIATLGLAAFLTGLFLVFGGGEKRSGRNEA